MPKPLLYRIYNEDCFNTFERIKPGSVDLVLVDPPYGTTANKWDSIIPLAPLWDCLKLICKKDAPIIFLAGQPFTSTLIISNLKNFRYCWVWNKVNRITGFLDAKKRPMRVTEDIVVFYDKQPSYNPQMSEGQPYTAISKGRKSNNYGKQADGIKTVSDGKRYPLNLLDIKADERGSVGRLHPTQKPLALMEYLIKTCANPGDTVLDFAMGSGTTGVASISLGRKFIGCDSDKEHGYFQIAKERIVKASNG